MQIPLVSRLTGTMEGVIVRFIPSINQLKLMANDTLYLEDAQVAWKPVLLLHEQKYSAAFVVEENDELITLILDKKYWQTK